MDLDLRPRSIERLAEGTYDLLVIGGGIIGAGIAEAASAHGLAVALVDRGDFGGATSASSSKLVHGGLRYLQLGDVGLVREAHQERRALMNVVAPHLVRRLEFVVPLYAGGPHRPTVVRTGILLYSALARARINGRIGRERALGLVPQLNTRGLRSCALYADASTNDARLTLANVRSAWSAGATVLNYAEAVAVGRAVAELAVDGELIQVQARAIVNATGPWVDQLRLLEDEHARSSVRLSKGVHVIVDGARDWRAAVTIPQDRMRVSFAVPWEGMLLLGTTDTPFDRPPDEAQVTAEDVRAVLDEAAVGIEGIGSVVTSFSGLRALPLGKGDTSDARRETVLTRGTTGMLSVAGGKLTTYRRIALGVLDQLGVRNLDRRPRPLHGATGTKRIAWPSELDEAARTHLLRLYGSLTAEVLAPTADDAGLLEPLVPGRPDIRAQEVYARKFEWARTDEDVLRRRTTAWLAPEHREPTDG